MKKTIIAGTISALAVGSLLGAGTFALFSDTETSADQSLTAGTLDLTIGGTGDSFGFLPISNLAPGGSGSVQITFNNVGSLNGIGTAKLVMVPGSDSENGCTEPELASALDGVGDVSAELDCETDLDGELDDHLLVSVTADGAPVYAGPLSGLLGVDGSIDLAAANAGNTDDTVVVVISYNLPGSAVNNVQSDSFVVRVEAQLNQA